MTGSLFLRTWRYQTNLVRHRRIYISGSPLFLQAVSLNHTSAQFPFSTKAQETIRTLKRI